MAYGLNRRISLKDNLALCLLILIDFAELGEKSYHQSWHSYPSKFIPFGRSEKYLEKILNKNLSDSSSYYRIKKEKVFSVDSSKIKIDLNSPWWQEYLNYRFRFFIAPSKWNHKWTVIIYDVPETERPARDNFRNVVEKIGFRCWQRSVWLTVNPVKKLLIDLIENWELDKFVTVFTAETLFAKNDIKMIKKLFTPEKLEKKYVNFLNQAQNALSSSNKQKISSLVKNYAELISEDTGLPGEFFSDSKIRQKLVSKYKQLITSL